ncbi:hypothetical protein PP914_gp074 [Arthrobacter phage Qui]|uniref:Uncharacterized protein n=1 Tax=Arthrobacter phage Qui TaxID=2603260 RepID=A0A5B8WFV8_9CAUD|nr:hypothetical protein PP914_gp074 [Arthrobacter phage Qui]QED11564.1 hypothetical protein SEA_QUI_74 [Arthrobacter phage Qui]QOC56396.1 hypothetical protein SEA_PAELLA_74 [Arthrobacter phage Paella]
MTWEDILLGDEVTTGTWMVPAYIGDCPDELWSLTYDIILI